MFKFRWPLAVLCCLLVLAALAGFKYLQIQKAIAIAQAYPEPSYAVEPWTTEVATIDITRTTIGEVLAPQSVILRNELEGRITRLNLSPGDTVKQGDLLVQLDISEETARLKAAQARLELARLDLQRVKKLLDARNVSLERVDQAESQFNVAQADIQALQATIDKKTIRAPFDARVGLHHLEEGEVLTANSDLATLVGLSQELWVDFSMPVEAAVTTGMKVTVRPSGGGPSVSGEVIASDSVANSSSRNLLHRASIPNHTFPPQSLVQVNVFLQQKQAIRVPAIAVLHDGMGDFVYVLEKQGEQLRAKRQKVSLGEENEQWIVVTEGLRPQQLIAARGSFKLRAGALITLADSQTETSSASQ